MDILANKLGPVNRKSWFGFGSSPLENMVKTLKAFIEPINTMIPIDQISAAAEKMRLLAQLLDLRFIRQIISLFHVPLIDSQLIV